jgi:hypothetical protein
MGIVYLAEQVDLGRRVALKFLKPELAISGSQRARLLVEATALARLQHPNIVQVFSTGTHEGRAFIVEEYVGGGSLDRKLAHRPEAARPAAALVATLARAVHHAHAQRIVHRDLKPGNVLLTTDGVPKISDFGLAKHFDPGSELGQTQTGVIVGSPSYMAPEQTYGKKEAVGPPADIYALGAILYEMVTGRPPFLAASMLDTLEQVRSADPMPPRQLQLGLPRDLETICMKCLNKDPARRYAAAAALAGDIDRFLEGRPILARPVSTTERLAKWVKRRPATAASLSVAALAAVALVTGGLIYQGLLRAALTRADKNAERAREQEKKADARYHVARATLNKMLDRFGNPDLRQTPRLKELQRAQLDDALGFYREVVKDRENPDPAVRFDVASAYLQSSLAQHALGRQSEGDEQASQAIALLERLVQEDPPRAEYRLGLARAYRTWGLGQGPSQPAGAPAGASDASPDYVERAASLLEKLLEEDPENRGYRNELAVTYHNRATVLRNRSWPNPSAKEQSECERLFRRAVDLRRSLLSLGPSDADAPVRVQLAESLECLAVIVQPLERDHAQEAPRLYSEGRQLLEDALKVDPKWDEAALALGHTLLNWGVNCSFKPASYKQAESLLTEAIGRLQPLLAREPSWRRAREHLLNSHGAFAQLRERQSRHAEAAREWEQVVSLAQGEQKEHHQFFLALALARAGEHRKAWEMVQSLKPSLSKRPGDYHSHLALVCSVCLAAVEKEKGLSGQERAALVSKYGDEAVALHRQAFALVPAAERPEWRATLRKDERLAPLHRRSDFQALIAEPNGDSRLSPAGALAPPGNK